MTENRIPFSGVVAASVLGVFLVPALLTLGFEGVTYRGNSATLAILLLAFAILYQCSSFTSRDHARLWVCLLFVVVEMLLWAIVFHASFTPKVWCVYLLVIAVILWVSYRFWKDDPSV